MATVEDAIDPDADRRKLPREQKRERRSSAGALGSIPKVSTTSQPLSLLASSSLVVLVLPGHASITPALPAEHAFNFATLLPQVAL